MGRLDDAAGLIVLLTDRVGAEVFDRAPALRVVANVAVGYDNIDLAEATRRGIAVANTPDVLDETTADFAFALMLAVARRVVEGDALVRGNAWSGWEPSHHLGVDVHGARLGIIGLGRIGAAVARRAAGFKMDVVYASPRPSAHADAVGATHVSLETLLESCDFVSLHCPLTEQTRHLIDGDALARCKSSAILINTARGACVDEAALVAALDAGQLRGAGLDVFEREPAMPEALRQHRRVVLAPHAGSASESTRRKMAALCVTAVGAVLRGGRPPNLVNPEVLS